MPPLTRPVLLFRGQKGPNGEHLNTYEWFSTSITEYTARQFSGCCIFVLTVMPPVKVMPIYMLDVYRRENIFPFISENKFPFAYESEVLVDCGILDIQSTNYTDKIVINAYYNYLPDCPGHLSHLSTLNAPNDMGAIELHRAEIADRERLADQLVEQGCHLM